MAIATKKRSMVLIDQTPSNVIRVKEASSPNPVNATLTKTRSAQFIPAPKARPKARPNTRLKASLKASLRSACARGEPAAIGMPNESPGSPLNARSSRNAAHFHM
jgi:hypothetical protein